MNWNKNCAQEIRQVKVPQLVLPPTGKGISSLDIKSNKIFCFI